MSHYLSGLHVLISGSSSPHAVALQMEFANACGNNIAIINSATLASSDNISGVHAQLNAALTSLDNKVDLFIIDARNHEPSGKDPIWEVPLSEWDYQDIASRTEQRRMLCQVKSFLQDQVRRSKEKNQANGPIKPFSIVILGHRTEFGNTLEQVIVKLWRDVSWLHRDASVNFIDVESSVGEASEQFIAAAVGILVASKINGTVISLDAIYNLRNPKADASRESAETASQSTQLCWPLPNSMKKPKVKVALSLDFDALSAFLGTGEHPDNNMSDYSTGIFSGQVGARRMLRMLRKHQLSDKVTWFIPGHTMETFEPTVKEVVESGAEIGLHGYSHEGAYQMTPEQEREVLVKCMEVSQRLTGKRVLGYRAPMYQLRETTIKLLKEFEFLYDSSLSHHDSQLYFTPNSPPIERLDFSKPASSWLRPTPLASMNAPDGHPLVEIPTNWHNEDMMAMQYFPHLHNSHGFVDARVVEQRWKDIFLWLWENAEFEREDGSFVFPILMHPDTSGMAHVIGMVDRFVGWLRSWGDSVQFQTFESIAREWLNEQGR